MLYSIFQISEVSTEGFAIVQQAAGRCIELTAGYRVRDLLKQAAEAMSGFLKVGAILGEELIKPITEVFEPDVGGLVDLDVSRT